MVDLLIMGVTRRHGSNSKRRIGLWKRGDVVMEYPGGTFLDPPHSKSPFIAVRVSDADLGDFSQLTEIRLHPTKKDKHGKALPGGRRARRLRPSFVSSLSRDEINLVTKSELSKKSELKRG